VSCVLPQQSSFTRAEKGVVWDDLCFIESLRLGWSLTTNVSHTPSWTMLVFKHLLEHITLNCKCCAIQIHMLEVNIWYRTKYACPVFVVLLVIIKFDMQKQPTYFLHTHTRSIKQLFLWGPRKVNGTGRSCQYHKLLCAFQMDYIDLSLNFAWGYTALWRKIRF